MATIDVRAKLKFIDRADVYLTEKPYSIDPEIARWTGPVSRSNFQSVGVDNILVQDIRGREHEFSFEKHGISVIELESAMSYTDFEDMEKLEAVYCQELASCLLHYFGASLVNIFDVQVGR
jgi:hypothetical protein